MTRSHRYLIISPLLPRIKRSLLIAMFWLLPIVFSIFGPFAPSWWMIILFSLLGAKIGVEIAKRLFSAQRLIIDTADQQVWVSFMDHAMEPSSGPHQLSDLLSCALNEGDACSELSIELTHRSTHSEAQREDHHRDMDEKSQKDKKGKKSKKKKSKNKNNKIGEKKTTPKAIDASSAQIAQTVSQTVSATLLRSTERRFVREAHRRLEEVIKRSKTISSHGLSEHEHRISANPSIDVQTAMRAKSSITQVWIIRAALLFFFGAQMWVVSSYYRGDYPWDERFSWRMFSTVRSLSCKPRLWFTDPQRSASSGQLCPDGRTRGCSPLRLSGQYHMVWVNLLKRGRLQVLDRVARDRCQSLGEGAAVFIELSCPDPEPPHASIEVQSSLIDLCASPGRRQP